MSKPPLFTIFTGTYNSESIIDRVFDSIKNQTCKEFEWIVIDDCSSDATLHKIKAFANQYPEISIQLIKHTQNTGVATSRKEALALAKGKYFITWDHDDIQHSKQLQIYKELWQKVNQPRIGSIFAKLTDQHGVVLGKKFPQEPFISDYINTHNTYLVGNKESGNVVEHHVCAKTEAYQYVLKHYEENPHLLEEFKPNGGDIWGMLAYLGYQTIYTNQVVRTYFINEEGRSSMSDATRSKSAKRVYLYKLLWVNYWEKKLKNKSLGWAIRNRLAVAMYGFLSKKSLIEILQEVKGIPSKAWVLLLSIPAYLLAKKFSNE